MSLYASLTPVAGSHYGSGGEEVGAEGAGSTIRMRMLKVAGIWKDLCHSR